MTIPGQQPVPRRTPGSVEHRLRAPFEKVPMVRQAEGLEAVGRRVHAAVGVELLAA